MYKWKEVEEQHTAIYSPEVRSQFRQQLFIASPGGNITTMTGNGRLWEEGPAGAIRVQL